MDTTDYSVETDANSSPGEVGQEAEGIEQEADTDFDKQETANTNTSAAGADQDANTFTGLSLGWILLVGGIG